MESHFVNSIMCVIDTCHHCKTISKQDMIEHIILSLQDYWDENKSEYIDTQKFNLDRILRRLIEHGYLTPELMEKWVNGEEFYNKNYYQKVGHICMDYWLTKYDKNYTYYNKQNKITGWIKFINEFSKNKNEKLEYLKDLIAFYPGVVIDSKHISLINKTCNAIDLLNYHFDINQLKQFKYKQYKQICVKKIHINDKKFDELINEMKKVW